MLVVMIPRYILCIYNTGNSTFNSLRQDHRKSTFYRKIELRIVHMEDNMHACTHEQEMVDHVIPELQDKVSDC